MADVLNRATKQYLRSVNTPDYPSADWIRNPDLSAVTSVPAKYWKITGDVVSEMDAAEKAVVDNSAEELGALKAARQLQIDMKTQELIAQGFIHAGKTFSLSIPAQIYWSNLLNVPANQYPLAVNTLDDTESYQIADQAEGVTVYGTALATVKGRLGSGTDLKNQIRAAATKVDVDAVIDSRT